MNQCYCLKRILFQRMFESSPSLTPSRLCRFSPSSSSPSSQLLTSSRLCSFTPRSSSSPPLSPTSSELALASSPSLRDHCVLNQPFGFLGAGVCDPEALKGQVRFSSSFKDRRASSMPLPGSLWLPGSSPRQRHPQGPAGPRRVPQVPRLRC